MPGLSCLVVVSFLDEAALLPTFLTSMAAQHRLPDRLVLVDDGSTDDSAALADRFAADRDWVAVLRRPHRPPTGPDRLDGAPELASFLWALQAADADEDVVVKMDADLDLAPEHVATVMAALEAEPSLGMAGTYLSARGPDGALRVEPHPPHHVRGPTRFYRRSCLEQDVLPLPTLLGWDGADEIRARDRGWRTRSVTLPGRPTVHLRPTGSHDGRLRARARWGACAYATGSHPLGVLAAAALRVRDPPQVVGSLAYVWGWASARPRHIPRFPADIRRAARREQLSRLRAGRRDAEPA